MILKVASYIITYPLTMNFVSSFPSSPVVSLIKMYLKRPSLISASSMESKSEGILVTLKTSVHLLT